MAKQTLEYNPARWPLGAMVRYTGQRVLAHMGQVGPIIGYRPTNGLWVRFSDGRASISVKYAELVSAPK